MSIAEISDYKKGGNLRLALVRLNRDERTVNHQLYILDNQIQVSTGCETEMMP